MIAVISSLTRVLIVLALFAMFSLGGLTLAAAGSTLSHPEGAHRLAVYLFAYLGAILCSFVGLVWLHQRAWVWLVSASVALAPVVSFLANLWVREN